LKKGVAGSGKDECYTTMSVQLWCNRYGWLWCQKLTTCLSCCQ
jgi:hypothetical protein